MITLPIPIGRLLIVPGETLTQNYEQIYVGTNDVTSEQMFMHLVEGIWNWELLPPGSWSLLGKASELTKEQMKLIVKKYYSIVFRMPRYKDYVYDIGCLYVEDSYASFLTFHGIKPEDVLLIENKK